MKKLLKFGLISLVSLLIILLIVFPFIPADRFRPEIEDRVSQALGMNVHLGDIAFISLPQPGIKITDIKLTDASKQIANADSIQVYPRISSLFSDSPEIRQLIISGIRIHPQDIQRFLGAGVSEPAENEEKASGLFIQKIKADHSYLLVEQKNLKQWGPFGFDINFNSKTGFQGFSLAHEEQVFRLKILPENDEYAVHIQASDLELPLPEPLMLTTLLGDGIFNTSRAHFDDIRINAYEGKINGNMILDWTDQWRLDSNVSVQSLNIGQLLKAVKNDSLDGIGTGKFTIRASSESAAELADHITVNGNFQVSHGHIYDTDLEKAARSLSKEWQVGGQTPFDEFNTQIEIIPQRISLKKMFIQSNVLAANGDLKILNQEKLDGELNVGLNDPTGVLTIPLLVSGTVNEPKVRPTNAALTGGAVGTAVLGPGLGTAVGIKAGEVFSKIGSLFGSDKDKKEADNNKKDKQ